MVHVSSNTNGTHSQKQDNEGQKLPCTHTYIHLWLLINQLAFVLPVSQAGFLEQGVLQIKVFSNAQPMESKHTTTKLHCV